MKAEDIMTSTVRCIDDNSSLVEAARIMRELDVGSLPICKNDRLTGMLTDRDIVVRALAEGRDPNQTKVHEAMSGGICYGFADQDVAEIAGIMERNQVRRLPIINRDKRLVGIISTGDVARQADAAITQEVMQEVSTPHA
jgi:CBS domain-containing protein